ncbi:MAG: GNAT family N-acetyltransferase [Betaproteobacteria bacterium]|nr:GNAT family N-acetyltransferase [Betaproteobacteria bacterium]
MRIELLSWDRARVKASPIRFEVFVTEQHVPAELELDEFDPHCVHALAYDVAGEAVGTGRLLPVEVEAGRKVSHIGRMAVRRSWRGKGVGAALLRALMGAARERGDEEIVLTAQVHALGFYRLHGFSAEGGEYLEAGIPHQTMRCTLD